MLNEVALTERVSLRGRAKLAYAGLFAISAVHLIAIAAGVWLLVLVDRIKAGEPVTQEQLQVVVRVADQLGVAYWVGMIFATITFLSWFHRAYKNTSYTAGATKSPGMAIAAWFIPFLNLVVPFTLAVEMWVGSAANPTDASARRGLWLLRVWWGLWIGSGVLALLLLSNTETPTLDAVVSLQYRALVVNAMRGLAAVFALLMVQRLTARQEAATLAPARVIDAG